MPSYTCEDFEQVVCEECGRETGQFYIAESKDERTVHLCLDCLMSVETTSQRDFNEATEKNDTWKTTERHGHIWVECETCGYDPDQDVSDKDGDRDYLTEWLNDNHDCPKCAAIDAAHAEVKGCTCVQCGEPATHFQAREDDEKRDRPLCDDCDLDWEDEVELEEP